MPFDLSASYYDQFQQALQRAEKAFANGQQPQAGYAYRRAADYLAKYAECKQSNQLKQSLAAREMQLRNKATALISGEYKQRARVGAVSPQVGESANTVTDELETRIVSLIERADVSWEQIAGLEQTKREIKSAYALTLVQKPAGVKVNVPATLLLYGPPGTGKTLIAAATSSGLDATFFNVKVSSVLSKFFGESANLMTALYQIARERSPSVIFLDEFDAISRTRGAGGESGAERRLLATLLAELDGVGTKSDSTLVLTIAATNRPWDVDSAVRSRFAREVLVPLPDEDARKRILEIHVEDKGHSTKVSSDKLVRETDGYSGREISQICEFAVSHMIERANPDIAELAEKGQDAIAKYQLKVDAITSEDFDYAFKAVGKPETTNVELREYQNWQQAN